MNRGRARAGRRSLEPANKAQIANVSVKATAEPMDFYNADIQEVIEDEDIKMENSAENGGDVIEKKVWRGPVDGKIRKKRKPTPGQKNRRLKKYVQPKNAVVCLNELKPGVVYEVEQNSSGCGSPTFVTVEVDGKKYRGFGSTKQLAKQAAAEAALISFVKAPPTPTPTGETPQEDTTPWTVLASFAMYKLFIEWREGRVGTMPPMMASGIMQDPNLSQTLQVLLGRNQSMVPSMEAIINEHSAMQNPALSVYLGKSQEENCTKQLVIPDAEVAKIPNPAKQVPINAPNIHPVMLLHQMRPLVQFTQTSNLKDGTQVFVISATIDGMSFQGEATNVKKAKFELAVKANQALFGVISTYEPLK